MGEIAKIMLLISIIIKNIDKSSKLRIMIAMETINIATAITKYLDIIKHARSAHTTRTYTNATTIFQIVLRKNKLDPATTSAADLKEDAIIWLAKYLKDYSPATEQLYLHAATGFYEFLSAERLGDINLPRLRLLIRQRARRPGIRLPQFPIDDIEHVLSVIAEPSSIPDTGDMERLRALRDRAFLLTLADTGLRVHELPTRRFLRVKRQPRFDFARPVGIKRFDGLSKDWTRQQTQKQSEWLNR